MTTALGPNMTLEEKRTEAKARLDEASTIEEKTVHGGTLTPAEVEQVKRLLKEVDDLHSSIQAEEETRGLVDKTRAMLDWFAKPVLPSQPSTGEATSRKGLLTPGEQFVRSAEYQGMKGRHLFENALNKLDFGVALKDGTSLLEWKATLASGPGTGGDVLVVPQYRPGVLEILPKLISVLDFIPRLQTESDQIIYVQQITQTLNVSFTPEATGSALTGTDGRKTESTLAFNNVTAPVRTAATWLPVTNRMLADAPAIRGLINSQLLMGLDQAVSAQVITGDGTGENLTGILNTGGIQTFGRGTFNAVDAIFHARTLCRTGSKLAPTGVLMAPGDYETMRLLREGVATGQYLMGPPNTLGVPTVWGIPIAEDENVPQGTVLVANWSQGSALFDREQSAIRVGLINDQLIRNQQTILAEARLAFAVFRPQAFVRITGY